jgi:hypothetical protein
MRHGAPRCSWRWMWSSRTAPGSLLTDVYARVCSCRQCWASKCRGL